MSLMSAALWAALILNIATANARWLRVAQREHYEQGRTTAMALIWCRTRPENWLVYVLALISLVIGLTQSIATLIGLILLILWPLGLSPKSTTASVAWTPRFRRLVGLLLLVELVLAVTAVQPKRAALLSLLVVPLTDLSLTFLGPLEKKLSRHFVKDAQVKLRKIRPTIVAITGSYGKTSTKLYVAHLLSASHNTVSSPASFNNLMGLSRAVNDRLIPGTEVFVAEMGTYGRGEIRELCKIFPPSIAAITTIGEAHLERMKNRATIVAAKSEVTERAGTVVLNVDVSELDDLAKMLAAHKQVIPCSSSPSQDSNVRVEDSAGEWQVTVEGRQLARIPAPAAGHPINLSIAIGIALALDVSPDSLLGRLNDLPGASHRAETQRTSDGVVIIDDTYNSNPQGAFKALGAALAAVGGQGRVFTVTPGMVELGQEQNARNEAFAAAATAQPNMTLAVTGRTNRKALETGVTKPGALRRYPNRQAATNAIMCEARAGDVVFYENDLPDHYP